MDDDPLNDVELMQGMTSMATLTRGFYEALVIEGFAPAEALMLTRAYLVATVSRATGDTNDA